MTLRQLFEERCRLNKDTAPRTLDDYRMALEKDVFPELGDRPANDIKPEEFAAVLEGVEALGPSTLRTKSAPHFGRLTAGGRHSGAVDGDWLSSILWPASALCTSPDRANASCPTPSWASDGGLSIRQKA